MTDSSKIDSGWEPRSVSIEQNKAIAIEFLTAVGEGRGSEMSRLLTDDATWWISGTTKFSGTYRIGRLLAIARGLFANTEGAMDVTFGAITAEEDRVCAEVRARTSSRDGRECDNQIHEGTPCVCDQRAFLLGLRPTNNFTETPELCDDWSRR
jgi:ketosteroid isomerase-like protein